LDKASAQSTGLAAHRRVPQSIGRSFVQSIILVTSAALLALLISAYVFVFEPYRGQITTAQLNLVAQQVQAELHTLVLRVEAVAKLRRDYGRSGLIDLDHVDQLVKLFAPYLLRGPSVSSMAIAQETGHEVLLLAQADGQWVTRISRPDQRRGKALFQTWNSDYALVKEEMRDTDYDARQRPWFVDALARPGTDAVYWTAPYVFRSTQLPGLSAVVRWTDPTGRRFISSTDVGLLDLSRFTRELVVSRHGFAAVFTDDGLVIGVPNDERFASDDGMKAAILRPVASLGMPALTEGYRAWREHGTIQGSDERFVVAGAAWVASFSRVPVGGQSLWVGTYAPEADFSLLAPRQALILLLLMLVTLALAWWAAIRLAAAYARPLAQLAQESERIGRLKLDRPVQVGGRWQEVRAMAQSQEAMRQRLLIAFEVVHTSERRANEGELRLRTLSNNLPNCIVYQVVQESDGSLRFTYISAAFERLVGIPVADALKDSSLLYRRVHPDDLPKLRSTRQWSAQNMKVFDLDVRVRHVDGRERWVNLVAAPRRLADGLICWDGVQTDITERRATERALVQYQLELTELTHQLMAQEKDTASRLAQILHDQLGQTLTAMRIDFVGDARFADPADNARHARVDRLIDQAVREVRQVLVELRPTVLDERGLVEALDNELRIRRPTLDGLHLLLDAPAQLATQRWNTDVEYAAFMVAREAIANALQHAKATLVRVTLSGDAHTLRLEVTDNGAGFASDTPAARPGHLGMVGMRERSIAIGARFEVRSSPDGGTSVCLAWEDGPS
jgi:PAS domain S-box-containing protein